MIRPSRRSVLSMFLAFHLAAVAVENLTPCALRDFAGPWAERYLCPLGLWQDWCMFAPEPFRVTPTLEAEVRDAAGRREHFDFPSLVGRPPWRSFWSFRHPKYAHNAMNDATPGYRAFAAGYVARRLGRPASAYPVEVRLYHRIAPISPPGAPGTSPIEVLGRGTYTFDSPAKDAR